MKFALSAAVAALVAVTLAIPAQAQSAAQAAPAVEKSADAATGKWMTKAGDPIYDIQADGTVDWFTYSGFRRYHSECHVCHGPEGQGSTYAPNLTDSLKTMDYANFARIVASGQQNVRFQGNSIMPALGDNKNVMCYLDDMYVYLKALSDNAMPRGKPKGRVDKTKEQGKYEEACLAG
ncbi:MAG: c-type cytochrome, methanol metabolism-related [Hyphomicrobiaceae bacterium]|nr:c-type cytochrome, methanol metabolism-related [Hyphomicrobiaceae bacterium]